MKKRLFLHIAFWISYLIYKSYLNYESGSYPLGDITGIQLFVYLIAIQSIYLTVKIPLVYSLLWEIDKYLQKKWSLSKTVILAIALFIAAIGSYMIISQFIVYNLILKSNANILTLNSIPGSALYTFFILCFVAGIAVSAKLIRADVRQKSESQELLKKKIELELQFLKSQTNPHFLFNTLNNIYALARKNSEHTAEVVLKLSNLMRYMLYETSTQYIPIQKEVTVINDYIMLEKIRYCDRLEVIFDWKLDDEMMSITPLLLLPFVENAFKHGAGESRHRSYIHIDLKLTGTKLEFRVVNSKEQDIQAGTEDGLGLTNIKRQLELIYPHHTLTIENKEDSFSANLIIDLQNE